MLHGRAAPLAAPHFWPTTAAALAAGRSYAATASAPTWASNGGTGVAVEEEGEEDDGEESEENEGGEEDEEGEAGMGDNGDEENEARAPSVPTGAAATDDDSASKRKRSGPEAPEPSTAAAGPEGAKRSRAEAKAKAKAEARAEERAAQSARAVAAPLAPALAPDSALEDDGGKSDEMPEMVDSGPDASDLED